MSVIATLPIVQVAETKVTGSSQKQIGFSSLSTLVPTGTNHLIIEISGAQTFDQRRFCEVVVNGDGAAKYHRRDFQAVSSKVSTRYSLDQTVGQGVDIVPAAANEFSGGYIFFPYAFRTDNVKCWQTMGSSLEQRLHRHICAWNDTSAIDSIAFRPWQKTPSPNRWTAGTTVTLYAVDERRLIEERVLTEDGNFAFTNFPADENHLIYLMHCRANYVNAAYVGDRTYHVINDDDGKNNYRVQRFGGEKIPNNVVLNEKFTEQRIGWSSAIDSPADTFGSLVALYPEFRDRGFFQPWISQHGTFDKKTYIPVSQENGCWRETSDLTKIAFRPKDKAGLYSAGSRIGAYCPSGLASRHVVAAEGAASVTLEIPTEAKALRCLVVARTDANEVEDRLLISLNGDGAASNYVGLRASARDKSHEAKASANEVGALPGATAPESVFGCGTVAIPQHSASDRHKHLLSTIGAAGGRLALYGTRWKSTAAVTSLTFRPKNGSKFAQGSVFELSFADTLPEAGDTAIK
ncbi:hypothetical protein [Ancylobacter defluvii]|uniref:Uncharacterized protein n=1 Tax=Ancylobacter defluvii TaxID=1282440 RepID=A0A9W6ND15_9HYPH|nr:hypothetical protein [Ancylobacter defluvii]MBS7586835.1 hypothetical protein [Ancylobacter defluvii]GLK86141.1 hypothetical protein GCM10017653_42110 [Ancylobacter defluvii]